MNRNKRALLEPHSKHFEAMVRFVHESHDEELERLMGACLDASTTNCAWSIYDAAQYLKRAVQAEQYARAHSAAKVGG